MTSPTSNQIVENHGFDVIYSGSFKVIVSSNFYLWWRLIGKMLMLCENETIGIQMKFN